MLRGEERENWTIRLLQVLGPENISALSTRQAAHLNKAFLRLIERKSTENITDM